MTQSSDANITTPAGLLPRIGAAVYDALLLLALFFLATALVDPFLPDDHVPAGTLWFQLYLLLVSYLFNGWFWTHGGQTLGMRAWRLRVTDESGQSIHWGRAGLRFLCAVPIWLTLVGLLFCIGGGLAPQDRLSRTRVVRLAKN